jgi:hypothetical protein
MATVDGIEKRIFGWETDAHGEEYGSFLRAFIPELLAHLKARGDDKRCYFHISDEPHGDQIEDYKKSQAQVAELLEGYTIMDAMSDFEFYKQGVMKTPIPNTRSMEAFIAADIPDMWTYYCGWAGFGCSSRMLAMPAARNRALGMQLYKFNIVGFLHWGFNFYNTSGSWNPINPLHDTSSGGQFPSGDSHSVYPGENGEPLESMRLSCFADGLCDLRAFKLCEKLYSREEVISALENFLGAPIRANTYVNSSEKMHALREMINDMIRAKI